jgi:hypothetical protein
MKSYIEESGISRLRAISMLAYIVSAGLGTVSSLGGSTKGTHCRPHVRHDATVSRQDDVAVSSSHEGEECACRA